MDFENDVRRLKQERKLFSNNTPIYISRAPGRLDLMGGNDDYTGGLVFESTIREATHAAAQLRSDGLVVFNNKTAADAGWEGNVTYSLEELTDENQLREIASQSPGLRWTVYTLGNIHYLKKKFPLQVTKGVTVYIDSNVPLNRGVSSSAAVEVAVMKAAAAAYDIDLTGLELALACQWVENTIAQSACGIMDQMAVVSGKEGFIMPLLCQPCNPEPLIQLPVQLKIWGIDSGVSHQVAGIEYEAARAAAFMGYKIICDHENIPVELDTSVDIHRYTDSVWNGYLANLQPSIFYEKYEMLLPVVMGARDFIESHQTHVDPFTPLKENVHYHIHANTKYAVEENYRVKLFSELAKGAAVTSSAKAFVLMGELMYQSHHAYTACGLGATATDCLVDLCRSAGITNGIYGAKITGGGAGGTVAILGTATAGPVVAKIFEDYFDKGFGKPFLFEGSSPGADDFGLLIIQ